MTIRNRELNRRLTDLESCAENAPAGCFEDAKDMAGAIGEISNYILDTLQELPGLKVSNGDRLRDLEAAIYGFVLEHNPGRFEAAEGFGEHVHGPARERIIAQVAAERNQLRAIQGA